jgi:hypothetical protein
LLFADPVPAITGHHPRLVPVAILQADPIVQFTERIEDPKVIFVFQFSTTDVC